MTGQLPGLGWGKDHTVVAGVAGYGNWILGSPAGNHCLWGKCGLTYTQWDIDRSWLLPPGAGREYS